MASTAYRRYWCANTAGGCVHALADTPFDQARCDALQGLCGGPGGTEGCGARLVEGEPLDPRPRRAVLLFASITTLAGVGWVVRTQMFPPPLQGLAFASVQTRVDDGMSTLAVEVVRAEAIDRRLELRCRSVDGSARAGQDFQPISQLLVFEPGERRKWLQIALLPDGTRQKPERHFEVMLPDVLGAPRHVVLIAPKTVDRTAQLQADQMVMMASRTAADIASLAVKRQVLDELMTSRRDNLTEFRAYKAQLAEVESNLVRAREGYGQALHDLQTHQPTLVLESMDRLGEDLARRSFTQQSRAMGVMKRQYGELLQHKSMDLDRWVQDLGKIIPKAPNGQTGRSGSVV